MSEETIEYTVNVAEVSSGGKVVLPKDVVIAGVLFSGAVWSIVVLVPTPEEVKEEAGGDVVPPKPE